MVPVVVNSALSSVTVAPGHRIGCSRQYPAVHRDGYGPVRQRGDVAAGIHLGGQRRRLNQQHGAFHGWTERRRTVHHHRHRRQLQRHSDVTVSSNGNGDFIMDGRRYNEQLVRSRQLEFQRRPRLRRDRHLRWHIPQERGRRTRPSPATVAFVQISSAYAGTVSLGRNLSIGGAFTESGGNFDEGTLHALRGRRFHQIGWDV